MLLRDGIGIRGYVVIEVRDVKTSRLIKRLGAHNTTTAGVRTALTDLLTQPAAEPNAADYNKIWSLYVGDGTTAPSSSDTSLTGSNLFAKTVDQPIVRASGGVTGLMEVTMTLGTGDANGITLTEVGLYTKGNGVLAIPAAAEQRLLARQVHSAISKTSGISVAYRWLYQITV